LSDVINIDVFGEKFSFKADLEDNSNRQALDFFLKELDETEIRLEDNSGNVSKLVKLLLATMNIANDYLEVEEELRKIEKDLKAETEKILLKFE
jgi:cell division protein ZapA (FtsZ GTPase activity inhibitor)